MVNSAVKISEYQSIVQEFVGQNVILPLINYVKPVVYHSLVINEVKSIVQWFVETQTTMDVNYRSNILRKLVRRLKAKCQRTLGNQGHSTLCGTLIAPIKERGIQININYGVLQLSSGIDILAKSAGIKGQAVKDSILIILNRLLNILDCVTKLTMEEYSARSAIGLHRLSLEKLDPNFTMSLENDTPNLQEKEKNYEKKEKGK